MVTGQNPVDNVDAVFGAHLADDVPDPQTDVPPQHLETVLRRPHQMIAVIKYAMLACVVLHDHSLQKNEP